jgi:NADH:ubiquinone oxidoreductase subunit C
MADASNAGSSTSRPVLDHPTFALVKGAFPGRKFRGTEFRGQSTLIVEPEDLHAVMTFLKNDPRTSYVFLSDIAGIDYLNYPAAQPGRFAVAYNLISFDRDDRFFVKVYVNPTLRPRATHTTLHWKSRA